jgi:hypothetical protein
MSLELALSRVEAGLDERCPPADESMDPEETCRIAMETVVLTERCMAQLAQTYRVMLSGIEMDRALVRSSRDALRESREMLRLDVAAKGARIA